MAKLTLHDALTVALATVIEEQGLVEIASTDDFAPVVYRNKEGVLGKVFREAFNFKDLEIVQSVRVGIRFSDGKELVVYHKRYRPEVLKDLANKHLYLEEVA